MWKSESPKKNEKRKVRKRESPSKSKGFHKSWTLRPRTKKEKVRQSVKGNDKKHKTKLEKKNQGKKRKLKKPHKWIKKNEIRGREKNKQTTGFRAKRTQGLFLSSWIMKDMNGTTHKTTQKYVIVFVWNLLGGIYCLPFFWVRTSLRWKLVVGWHRPKSPYCGTWILF